MKSPVKVREVKRSLHNKKSAIQNFAWLNDIYVTRTLPH